MKLMDSTLLGRSLFSFFAAMPDSVTQAVSALYDTYPFPPEPMQDGPPPGYNWRWHYPSAYAFCTGQAPKLGRPRILDAGCGTGVSTDYLAHLNPSAEITAIDISAGTLAVAQERCRRSGVADRIHFQQLSLYNLDQLPGEFDQINCVGVLHHLEDPDRGLAALASKLAPGGILHIFVYAEIGRAEIRQMQAAIALLQGERRGDYRDGVAIGREIFSQLPANNRLRRREEERWALENQRDECFADMYVHPQEIDYNTQTLRRWIEGSGLTFLGFSDRDRWNPDPLFGTSETLRDRFQTLSEWQRYRLIELLDPEITHFEFFLGRSPLPQCDWSDDELLLQAKPVRNECLYGWPSRDIFDPDYRPRTLSEAEYAFLEQCDRPLDSAPTVAELLQTSPLNLAAVRQLIDQQLILLVPAQT